MVIMARIVRCLAVAAFVSLPGTAGAQELRLFDAHLHYNQEAMSLYPLDKALEVKPDDPLAFANLGVVYLLQGIFPAATASLRRALLLQGSDPVLNYNLGLSLMFEQVYDQARDQFERALQLKPDFAAAAYHLALIYEQFDSAQARERWRKYLALARGKLGEDDWVARADEHLQRLQQP